MSQIHDTASVAIPGTSWLGLQALIAGDRAPEEAVEDLQRRGILEGETLTEDARFLLHGFLDGAGAIRLFASFGGRLRESTAWLASDRVALIDQLDGDTTILRRNEPGFFPLTLLQLLSLGPRPALLLEAPQDVPENLVTGLVEPSPGEDAAESLARELRPVWPEVYEAMADEQWRCWVLQAFAVGDEPQARLRGSMCVLDTSGGILGADFHDGTATLTPLLTSDVWKRLSDLIAPAT